MIPQTSAEARHALLDRLVAATPDQVRDLASILRLGAGDLGLPEGATMAEPRELPVAARPIYAALAEAVAHMSGDGLDAAWEPVEAGAWEPVTASLVIAGEWGRICECAEDLRAEQVARIDPALHLLRTLSRGATTDRARADLEAARKGVYEAVRDGDEDLARRWMRSLRAAIPVCLSEGEQRIAALEACAEIEGEVGMAPR